MSKRHVYGKHTSVALGWDNRERGIDEWPGKPLTSQINLTLDIAHSKNLHTDAQGLVDEVERFVTERLAQYDNLGSARARLISASTARRENA